MPDDIRVHNPKAPWVKLEPYQENIRPKSALNLNLNFDLALQKTTENAGERLKYAY